MASGTYLDKGEPVVLLGDSGTGKSHLLIGMGMAACEQGRSVRYATCAGLVNELVEAADERRLRRIVARYGRLDLLLLDELGYVQLDTRGAELFFQILTEREEKSSIAVASNLPFSEWGQVITDPRLVAAIVDRLTFRAHIIETGTESFRLRTHPQARAGRLISGPAGGRRWPPPRRTRTGRTCARPRRAVVVLLVQRIGQGLEEVRIAPSPADVFGWTGSLAPSRHTPNFSRRATRQTSSTTTSCVHESPKS